ncbi:TlpA family protein disulfide reductase [Fulvivirgaceae bacterium PWU5]|uniref:TlpA family protein disulfide reductase n=1 Tax=Dawidia cretensis TaxID=2782350 RepID=A0AAP2GUA1_9BACT|nr:TlpA disulfide reductase family protein [Dawidia cretensis]MBT1707247.1 TlpA family protein disulfide reductase [Dawidia cretensis]
MSIRKSIATLSLFFLALVATAYSATPRQNTKTVIIAGKVISPKANSSITLAINWVGFEQEELKVPVDAAGNFVFKFEAYVPTDAWIVYQTNFLILFHPGDSIYLEFDGTTSNRMAVLKSAKFSGDAAASNKGTALFQQAYAENSLSGYNYEKHTIRIKNSTPSQFVQYCDSLRHEALNFHAAFVKKQGLNQEAARWSKLYVGSRYYHDLRYFPDAHRAALVLKESEWDVPLKYYDFLRTYDDVKQALVSGDAINSYINKYAYTYIRRHASADAAALKRSLTKEQQDSIKLWSIVRYSKDAFIKEITLCYFLNDWLEQSALETFEKNRNLIDANLTQPFLREPLFKKYALKKKEVEGLPAPAVERLVSGVSFVDSVIQQNRGKVIYIDIWATWCGPCRQEFPYAKKLEDAFGDNVVFLYLCLESGEDAYQNLLKKYAHKGIHKFLDEEQSKLLRAKYKVQGVPHYMLIDKDGHIVNVDHSIKPSADETPAAIRGLL